MQRDEWEFRCKCSGDPESSLEQRDFPSWLEATLIKSELTQRLCVERGSLKDATFAEIFRLDFEKSLYRGIYGAGLSNFGCRNFWRALSYAQCQPKPEM